MTTEQKFPFARGADIPFIYRHVGARSVGKGLDAAESRLQLRPDLCGPNGIYAATLGVLLQDLSSVTIARVAPLVVPIQLSIRIRKPVSDTTELFATGVTHRRGKTVQATEASVYDSPDRTNLVAFMTGAWHTVGSNQEPGPDYPGAGTPEEGLNGPGDGSMSLLRAIGASVRSDNRGYELREVEGGHVEPIALGGTGTGTLHAGAFQVLMEGGATIVAKQRVPEERLAIEDMSTQFLAPARATPITSVGQVVSLTDTSLDARVEMWEGGTGGRLVGLTFARFRILPD
jgi:acyl-coenzyme A thioesterase PaaI-like protein